MTATNCIAATTITVRNITEGRRTADGEMTLAHLGDVTVTLQGMTRAELAEWEWATDALNIGMDEEVHRGAMEGWKVVHPQAGLLGLLFQGAGTRVHVEWYDPATEEFYSAGCAAKLRHGAAQIVHARQRAGHGAPVDATPEPVKAPAPARPVWLPEGTLVRYHGSLQELRDGIFRVDECDCCECDGYRLVLPDVWSVAARHVRPISVTALAEAA